MTYGFFAIWTVLCCYAYSAGGTMVLRNLSMRTPLAVGFMLGVGCVLVQMLLVLAVMSGEGPLCEGKPTSVRERETRGEERMALAFFFLMTPHDDNPSPL